MSEKPKRKKSGDISRGPGPTKRKRRAPDIGLGARSDLDLRTLIVLSVGEWWEFADHEEPPDRFAQWIESADLGQLRGILLAVLARWHDLNEH